jgi:aryl-alcohol dehydrogenase-like predicted oxidoreductase
MDTAIKTKGFATAQGTERFKARFKNLSPGHFRNAQGLWFSSIGLGTYLGDPDDRTDALYAEAVKTAVKGGINLLDTAINYRCQRSERALGKAIASLVEAGEVSRDELILCTKGGFLPFDGSFPASPETYFQKSFIDSGLLRPEEIAQGCHALSPRFLEKQLEASLDNLRVEAVDIYYLHNPETQLSDIDRVEFIRRMRSAFEFLEKMVAAGTIRMYGTATWSGYRVSSESREYLSLQEFHVLAREVGGPNNHFRFAQLPVNLGMPDAWVFPNQGRGGEFYSFLSTAKTLGIHVVASAALLQGRLAQLPAAQLKNLFPNLKTAPQGCLQFARSCPGVVTALVGMKDKAHVLENLETAAVEPLDENELAALFQKNG